LIYSSLSLCLCGENGTGLFKRIIKETAPLLQTEGGAATGNKRGGDVSSRETKQGLFSRFMRESKKRTAIHGFVDLLSI